MNEMINFFVFSGFILLPILAICSVRKTVKFIIDRRRRIRDERMIAFVAKTSRRYAELSRQVKNLDCNCKSCSLISENFACNSLSQLRSFDGYEYFKRFWSTDNNLREVVFNLRDRYNKYLSVYREVCSRIPLLDESHIRMFSHNLGVSCRSVEIYHSYENSLCASSFFDDSLCPIVIDYFYSSPAGRNYYHNQFIVRWDGIDLFIDKMNSIKGVGLGSSSVNRFGISRDTIEHERNKMSPKLRYHVLQRDGFRCVMCGRTSQDGVTLHVDHIIPVAKGGLTVLDNLQCLCEDCNRGKGVD